MPESSSGRDLTTDSFLGGRLILRQPRRGHRAGTDAVLLAAAVPATVAGRLLDIGAGVGAAGMAAAALRPDISFGLVEIDPHSADLASENLALNGLSERGRVFLADVLDRDDRRRAGLEQGGARVVITNPPFYDPARARRSPDAGKSSAHVMPVAGGEALENWIKACLYLLAEDGFFILIHRPDALPAILRACQSLGGLSLLSVHSQQNGPANRILLRGRKGSRAPLTIARPLILHAGEGFTPEAEAIHRGAALIDW